MRRAGRTAPSREDARPADAAASPARLGRGAPLPRVATLAALGSLVAGCDPGLTTGHVALVAETGASSPTVAVEPASGATLVAWVASTGSGDVYLARDPREPGDEGEGTPEAGRDDVGGVAGALVGFAPPVRVNDVPGDAGAHEQAPAQVAVGPEGNVYVLWQKTTPIEGRRFPASDLRLARSTDGGRSFEPAIYVNDDAGGRPTSHTFHDLEVAPDGIVYASWIDGRNDEAESMGGSVARRSVDAARHHHGPGAGGPEIRVARSTDGGRTFGPGVVVADGVCPCCRTSMASARDGTLYVAWRKVFEGNVRDIVVARSDDGGRSFGAPARVHEDGWVLDACPHAGPGLAVDGDGALHVAWFTGSETAPGLFHAVSTDGGRTFGAPRALVEGPVTTSHARLARDDDGFVWIAWDDRRPGEGRIRVARARGAHEWEEVAPEEPLTGTLPAVSASSGRVAVTWLDGDAVRVYAAAP